MRTHPLAIIAIVIAANASLAQDGLVATPKGEEASDAELVIDDRQAPPEQDEALKLFVGTWRCTGTSSTEFGDEVPTTYTITGKKDLGGRWLAVKTELAPKTKGAKSTTTTEVWGLSRHEGLVRNGAGSDGAFLSSTSTGWAGERLSWSGTSSHFGKAAKEKLSFERKSDKELAVMISVGPTELRVVFEGTCKR